MNAWLPKFKGECLGGVLRDKARGLCLFAGFWFSSRFSAFQEIFSLCSFLSRKSVPLLSVPTTFLSFVLSIFPLLFPLLLPLLLPPPPPPPPPRKERCLRRKRPSGLASQAKLTKSPPSLSVSAFSFASIFPSFLLLSSFLPLSLDSFFISFHSNSQLFCFRSRRRRRCRLRLRRRRRCCWR